MTLLTVKSTASQFALWYEVLYKDALQSPTQIRFYLILTFWCWTSYVLKSQWLIRGFSVSTCLKQIKIIWAISNRWIWLFISWCKFLKQVRYLFYSIYIMPLLPASNYLAVRSFYCLDLNQYIENVNCYRDAIFPIFVRVILYKRNTDIKISKIQIFVT